MLFYKTHHLSPEAPWIVFIHGAGGSSDAWQHQWEHFKNHFNLMAMDLRDHGKSKNILPEKKRYSFRLISRDIIAVLDNAGIHKAHFITLSFGSVLMQDLSKRKPGLVASATMAGGIFKGNIWIKGFVHFARLLNIFLTYPQMYRLFSKILMPKKRHQLSRRVYQIYARQLTSEEYLKWLGLYSTFFLTLKRFYEQTIHFPALVVMGADDYVFLQAAKDFSEKHKKVELAIIKQAGHICNIDQPDKFNYTVHQFLKSQDPKPKFQIA
ncbi:MAG: alpha/beta hydrolase [Fulvivirga sp.]|nr:alpha/beta hydrolase [Fulvivirga sp.]